MPKRNLFVSEEESRTRKQIIDELLLRVRDQCNSLEIYGLDWLSLRRYFQKIFWSLSTPELRDLQRVQHEVEMMVAQRDTRNRKKEKSANR